MPDKELESGSASQSGYRAEDRSDEAWGAAEMSIVMPTHNRAGTLRHVLSVLEQQITGLPSVIEVLVCDDASTDDTRCVLQQPWRFPLQAVHLEHNSGPAIARNRALSLARGRVILFLGDDIEPHPELLDKHLAWHRAHDEPSAALLGRTTWPPRMEVTPFMRFLEGRGRAYFFDYLDLPEGEPVPGSKFYTCNVSFKRKLYEEVGGFDEHFPFASHEDLEYGLRLERTGMRLFYDATAIGYHWHALDLPGMVRRVYQNGRSSVYFWSCVQDHAGSVRRGARRLCRAIARVVPFSCIEWLSRFMPSSGWYGLLALAYWRGAGDAMQGYDCL